MTPAELHAWVRDRWQELLDIARAATEGPWLADPTGTVCAEVDLVDDMLQPIGHGPQEIAECYRSERPTERADNAAHIAAFDPTLTIAVCEAALGQVNRHRPHEVRWCWYNGYPMVWPCDDFRSLAAPFRTRPDYPEELRRDG